jgi:hypothetical protein
MNEEKCENISIEDLNVSEQCLDSLRESGFSTVGELVEFLEQTWGGRAGTVWIYPDFLKYLDETIHRLKVIGCWPEGLREE